MKAIWEFIVVRCLRLREPNLRLHTRFKIWPLGTRYVNPDGRMFLYVKIGGNNAR